MGFRFSDDSQSRKLSVEGGLSRKIENEEVSSKSSSVHSTPYTVQFGKKRLKLVDDATYMDLQMLKQAASKLKQARLTAMPRVER